MAQRMFLVTGVLAAVLLLSGSVRHAPAQDAPPQEPPPELATPPADVSTAPAPAEGREQVTATYRAKLDQWKDLLKRLRTLKHEYQLADEPGRLALEQQWEETIDQANQMLSELTAAATAAYQAAPNEDRELTSFLVKVLQDLGARDQYAAAAALGSVLIENQCDMPQIYRETGNAYFALHEFERTLEILDKAQQSNALDIDATELRKQVETYIKLWEDEVAARQREAEADDLPRVKLTTTKGEVIVELFENEAPDTVGNFVSLVKSGFYDGLSFHRVIAGFMAQGGCPEGDGSGGPGYRIYDEVDRPGARQHFRGVLSMAKTNAPHSGGSQFFITFRPTPHLNGVHTVFGRVLEGMDVVDSLQRIEPGSDTQDEPDRILKAEVIRDRGHEYLPKKVE